MPGESLAEILAFIKRKGPLDTNDNKRVAALTVTRLHVDTAGLKFEQDGEVEETPEGGKRVRTRFGKLEVELTVELTFPKLKKASALSKAARKEWDRYFKCLGAHETRHVHMARDDAMLLVSQLNTLRGEGTGADLRTAARAAADNLFGKMNDLCGGTKLDDRQKEIHEMLDKATGHGAKEGAELDTSID